MERNRPWHYAALIPLCVGVFLYLAWDWGWSVDGMRTGVQDSPALAPAAMVVGGSLFVVLGVSALGGLIFLLSVILRRIVALLQRDSSATVSGVLRPGR